MYLLALHNDIDAGVCLLHNTTIVDAVSEERFNRVKLYKGFPELGLNHVLARHGIAIEDIDYFIYPWYAKQNDYPAYIRKLTARILLSMKRDPSAAAIIQDRIDVELRNDAETRQEFEQWMQSLNIPKAKILYLDHHHCHAWSAFAASPYDEAFVFTFDGRGDLRSATASYASKTDGICEYDDLLTFDSLGYLYGQITRYLGFTPHRHEGKITGLAAYGDPQKTLPIFRQLFTFEGGKILANLGIYKPFFAMTPELQEQLNAFTPKDIAAGLQAHCEDLVAQYMQFWMDKMGKPGVNNVCLAGGVFANVKLNQRIAELERVKNLFVFPHMGDGGLPFGGVCAANYLLNGLAKVDFSTVYLGPSYADEEIRQVLEFYSGLVRYEYFQNTVEVTVHALINQQVVGYFDHRMEYGPRALGARSILYHARDASVNDWLNKRLKRTEFMPFAPVTPAKYASRCYIGWTPQDVCSQFMTQTYHCSSAFAERHQAVIHVDGTARPQIVFPELHGDYYRIVAMYCEQTGESALINTSFNKHEEPIVCSPRDAVQGLLNGIVDVLILGNYRVTLGESKPANH